jgi:hypothetical protein
VATGFRRSLGRHGGRTVAALIVVVIVGQGQHLAGWTVQDRSTVAQSAARVVATDQQSSIGGLVDRAPDADSTAFDGSGPTTGPGDAATADPGTAPTPPTRPATRPACNPRSSTRKPSITPRTTSRSLPAAA